MAYTDIISIERAKNYLRIDDTESDNSEIEAMIEGALQFVETYTNHILTERPKTVDSYNGKVVVYDYPINGVDTEVLSTCKTALKTTYTLSDGGSLTYIAGYENVADIPKALIQAALQIIKVWYFESEKEVNETMLPLSVIQVLDSYKRFR